MSCILANSHMLAAPSPDHDDPIHSVSDPPILHGLLRLPRSSLRRLLRIWLQTRLQHQRLRPQYPRSRRYDRPYGLPVRTYFTSPTRHRTPFPSHIPSSRYLCDVMIIGADCCVFCASCDRFLMGVFVYVYHSSLIREHHVTVGSVLQTIVSGLSTEEQLELLRDMKRYLEGQGISVGF